MSNAANVTELGSEKISKLLWRYALPAIVGTLVNSLYNIIDRVFIGHWVGDEALAALGLMLPLMNLTAAVGMLVGAGSASRMSISLGEKDIDKAERTAGTAFLMLLVLSGATIGLLYLFIEPILLWSGASEATYHYAHDFLVIFLPGNLFLSMAFSFNNMMRASGYPQKAMLTMLISVVANIILAPIFIKGFNMGMKGAAWATLISMVIAFVFVMHHFLNANSFIRLRLKNIRYDKKLVGAITSIGMSPFFIQLGASVVAFMFISQLKRYAGDNIYDGDMAVGAYTLANTLIMLIVMIVIGLTQGMQPIVGYNYGAKNFARVKETLIYTIKVGVSITSVGFLLGFFMPHLFIGVFGPGPALTSKAVSALQIIVISMPLVGFQIVVTNFFQSIGMAKKAIFLSLTRQFIFLVPALYIFPLFWGTNGIWIALPSADILASVVTLLLFIFQIRQFQKISESNLIS